MSLGIQSIEHLEIGHSVHWAFGNRVSGHWAFGHGWHSVHWTLGHWAFSHWAFGHWAFGPNTLLGALLQSPTYFGILQIKSIV